MCAIFSHRPSTNQPGFSEYMHPMLTHVACSSKAGSSSSRCLLVATAATSSAAALLLLLLSDVSQPMQLSSANSTNNLPPELFFQSLLWDLNWLPDIVSPSDCLEEVRQSFLTVFSLPRMDRALWIEIGLWIFWQCTLLKCKMHFFVKPIVSWVVDTWSNIWQAKNCVCFCKTVDTGTVLKFLKSYWNEIRKELCSISSASLI